MEVFRFKRFEVRNELAAQKVGTDAVLLGATLTLPDTTPQTTGDVQQERSDKSEAPGVPGAEPQQTAGDVQHLLDIGTGTGVIALMAAQRLADRIKSQGMPVEAPGKPSGTQPHFKILAIDIDPAAITEATANFAASPWAPSLHAKALSLNDLERQLNSLDMAAVSCERRECRLADAPGGQRPFPACPEGKHLFAAIFSNPPYFQDSLKAPDARRCAARHTDTLSYREICAFAASHLTPDGTLSLILPAADEQPLLRYAASFGLRSFRILRIRTTARKVPSRIIAEFCREGRTPHRTPDGPSELILMNGTDRTPAYAALTKDFYL